MLPTMGRVVFYHFTHEAIDGTEVRTRPAVVVQAYDDGKIDAHVHWNRADNPLPRMERATRVNSWVIMEPLVVDIPAHREATGELGKIEKANRTDHTWSWPPRTA